MKTVKFILLISVSGIFFSACATTPTPNDSAVPANTTNSTPPIQIVTPAATPDKFAAAREIYTARCGNCHKETGEGGEAFIEDIQIDVPNFKDPEVAGESDADYIRKIERGGDGMPKFKGKLSDEEIKNLVSFIRSEFQGKQ